MKAILDKHKSKIIAWSHRKGIYTGPLPDGVPLDRIRWTGSSLVDVSKLTAIYVLEEEHKVFSLHARPVRGSQLVNMTYNDRHNLINDQGVIRLKTQEEIAYETKRNLIEIVKQKASIELKKQVGMVIEQFLFTHKLLYALIWSLRTENTQGLQFVDAYLAEMDTAFDLSDPAFKNKLVSDYEKFRAIAKSYLEQLESLSSSHSSSRSSSESSSSSSSSESSSSSVSSESSSSSSSESSSSSSSESSSSS